MYWSEDFIKTCLPKLEMVAMPLTTIVVVILLMGWWNRSKCENDSEQNPWMTYIIENNQNVGFFSNKRMLDPFACLAPLLLYPFFWLYDDRRFFPPSHWNYLRIWEAIWNWNYIVGRDSIFVVWCQFHNFLSNHNVHKSSRELYFWAPDPLIHRFYYNLLTKGQMNLAKNYI